MAIELSPIDASSHEVPNAAPARNAALRGYHMSRTPVPVAGIEPTPDVPVTANPFGAILSNGVSLVLGLY